MKMSLFFSSSLVFAVALCCIEESPHSRTLILGILHCSSSLATGEFPLSCSLSSSFSDGLSCSLLFLFFPKRSFQHCSRGVACAQHPAHTPSCMWTCLTSLCVQNVRAINHGHGNMIPVWIS